MVFEYFDFLLVCVSTIAAGVASLSGFGIGSILTPLLATRIDTGLAVAAISIPHVVATSLRCWMLRKHINKEVLIGFGSLSAIGGLAGALFHSMASNPALTILFALLLIYVGASGYTGWTKSLTISKKWSSIAGLSSGLLGGLVGNQGGIRSAALLGLNMKKNELVGTATAIGVIVDLARMPVYIYTEGNELLKLWLWIALATAGCIIGTFAGKAALSRLPEELYRKMLFIIIAALGVYMVFRVF